MDYTISASYYEKEKWPLLWTEHEKISVLPENSSTVDITLVTPSDLQTGIYQGFLIFESEEHIVNAPISFAIKQPVSENDSTILIKGTQSDDVLYGNGYTKGAFDMVNRYMAGDWRQYYFDIQNESINTAAIELSWISNNTNLSVFVMDPSGKIIQTNVPSGVFGHFMGWASLDWLGNSIFSQGGGFFPVKNKDDTSTVLYVPINQTGTYTLLTHSTLFGGDSTTEPITLAAKFMHISPEMFDSQESVDVEIKSTPAKSEDISEIITKTEIQDQKIIDSELPFGTGIAVGIVIGIAIGLVFILIIRQKPTKD
jgi:hypothetical protein